MDEDFDLTHIESKATEYVHLAKLADEESRLESALIYYKEAIDLLMFAKQMGSEIPQLMKTISQYLNRAEQISKAIEDQKLEPLKYDVESNTGQKNQSTFKTAQFLFEEALQEDELGNYQQAILLYTEAIDLSIQLKKSCQDENRKHQMGNLISQAFERAEILKGKANGFIQSEQTESSSSAAINGKKLDEDLERLSLQDNPSSGIKNEHNLMVVGDAQYSVTELAVLRKTSTINGREYVPFLSIDLKERFAYPTAFQDPNGLLQMSAKQKEHFNRWARLSDLNDNPKIIKQIDWASIKQTLVTDCSFVASLTVAALYEKRFKKQLVTSLIYPQNRNRQPLYNACGKYMIKFYINGIARKVIIDDRLPIDRYSALLCSHSLNCDEFWVSILEKAYMKVMGGYDFPGSNSSIDLNALTGWIPDKIDLRDGKCDPSRTFKALQEKHAQGMVLITVATGNLPEHAATRAGLVPNHAYALLDLREAEGRQLLLLKNPWRHMRWKGNYSECDTINWTDKLKKAFNYDPTAAKNFDTGVFWIDLKSFMAFFELFYLNWNVAMFKYTFCTHSFWSINRGPTFDSKVIYDNPQFSLELSDATSSVWVLLSRHITDKDDFAENKVFLAIMVYKSGKKVYIPDEPFINGVRVNSPHYLCKIPVTDCKRFTLVLSQYEKTSTIYYSLRVYSMVRFKLAEIKDEYKYKREIKTDQWTEANSGGCMNNLDTYSRNPVYRLEVCGPKDDDNEFLIKLKGPKEYAIGMDLHAITIRDSNSPNFFHRKSCDVYRYGINVLKLERVPPGTYNLIPSTFNKGQKSPYFLSVESTCNFQLNKIN